MSFSELIAKIQWYLPSKKIALVEKAYEFAVKAHEGQMRMSREPYINHPLQVAMILAELQLDADDLR